MGLDGKVEKFWIQTNEDQNLCYHVPECQFNFSNAQAYRHLQNSTLAILDASNKSQPLTTFYFNRIGLNETLWLGLINVQYSNSTVAQKWINGNMPTYTNYAYPPNGTIQDCFAMGYDQRYEWYLDSCSKSHHFLCQKG